MNKCVSILNHRIKNIIENQYAIFVYKQLELYQCKKFEYQSYIESKIKNDAKKNTGANETT